jgi:hypothetical protein
LTALPLWTSTPAAPSCAFAFEVAFVPSSRIRALEHLAALQGVAGGVVGDLGVLLERRGVRVRGALLGHAALQLAGEHQARGMVMVKGSHMASGTQGDQVEVTARKPEPDRLLRDGESEARDPGERLRIARVDVLDSSG